MFQSIFTGTADTGMDTGQTLIAIAVALLLGFAIAAVYSFVCKKEGYSRDFIIGLVLLPAVVAVVIMLIGSNVARAFSMAGAFALVRFRSAPGSGKDIAIVFFTMAAGLSCGLGYVGFAVIFAIIILLVLILLTVFKFFDATEGKKQLRITIPENLNYTEVFDEVFDEYLKENKLTRVKTTNMGTMFELTYIVRMKENVNEKAFIDALRIKNGNLNIILGLVETNGGVLN